MKIVPIFYYFCLVSELSLSKNYDIIKISNSYGREECDKHEKDF